MRVLVVVCLISACFLLSACNDGIRSETNSSKFKNYREIDDLVQENKTEMIIKNENPSSNNTSYAVPEDYLDIASFNLQIFGISKVSNDAVSATIANIMDDYDIVAVQEIRDKSETAFPDFMAEYLPEYSYVMSERLGRTSSKEQYAFVYKGVTAKRSLTYPDSRDEFEREPFAQEFNDGGYNFVIIQIHVKPDDAQNEICALSNVVIWAKSEFGIDEIILLGDLNADCSYYTDICLLEYDWVISSDEDTTTSKTDCAYDRIIIPNDLSVKIVESGVDLFNEDEAPDRDLMEAVSDHYPVYLRLEV
jgi:deoxyribonuclease-1-like protein